MQHSDHIAFPKSLDEPPFVLIFRMDDLAVFSIFLCAGFLFDAVLLVCLIGIVATWAYRRFRAGRQEGYLVHVAYWYGLSTDRIRSMPNAFIRFYQP